VPTETIEERAEIGQRGDSIATQGIDEFAAYVAFERPLGVSKGCVTPSQTPFETPF
jgi:hypothetical protein